MSDSINLGLLVYQILIWNSTRRIASLIDLVHKTIWKIWKSSTDVIRWDGEMHKIKFEAPGKRDNHLKRCYKKFPMDTPHSSVFIYWDYRGDHFLLGLSAFRHPLADDLKAYTKHSAVRFIIYKKWTTQLLDFSCYNILIFFLYIIYQI